VNGERSKSLFVELLKRVIVVWEKKEVIFNR